MLALSSNAKKANWGNQESQKKRLSELAGVARGKTSKAGASTQPVSSSRPLYMKEKSSSQLENWISHSRASMCWKNIWRVRKAWRIRRYFSSTRSSTVYKRTPPDLNGEKHLAKGYPAITASVVNTRVPGICYANWFSFKTADFICQNREIQRAIRTTGRVFPICASVLSWILGEMIKRCSPG